MYCDDLEEYQLTRFLNPTRNLHLEGLAGGASSSRPCQSRKKAVVLAFITQPAALSHSTTL